jgi:hypothetical protein
VRGCVRGCRGVAVLLRCLFLCFCLNAHLVRLWVLEVRERIVKPCFGNAFDNRYVQPA